MGIYGQDWASYQSIAPDTSGLAFFFTKITQGMGYENPKWRDQYAHGKGAGLVPGKYHYPDMNNPPSAEGDYFLARASVEPGDMVVLDWEGYDKANQGVPKSAQAAYKDAWLKHVKGLLPHNPVGMYCNTDYWRSVDRTGYYGDFLWIATGGLPAGQPGIQAPWLFHQYSTAGDIDRDYCHLASADALRAWVASFQETDMPLTQDDINKVSAATVAALTDAGARDSLAFADVYWLRRAFDPTIPLPTGKNLPGVVTETAALRAALVAQSAAQKAAIEALVKAIGASGGITAEQVQAAAEAGAKAALAELGHVLDGTQPTG